MPAGTIALRNNTATVTGTGTSFTTEIKANDFIVVIIGQVTYTLGVKSVNSNTSVTLIRNFDGPTSSGLAWTAIPNATLVGITAQVAADTAKAIRGLNLDKVNWQQILTGTGNVTVNLPDGSAFSGPAWGGINEELKGKAPLTNGVVAVKDGGTGGKTQADARKGLGLGTASVVDIMTQSDDATGGRAMTVGAFGLGATTAPTAPTDMYSLTRCGVYAAPGAAGINYFDQYSPVLAMVRYDNIVTYLQISPASGRAAVRGQSGGKMTGWNELYTTGNTTRSSDGTLKAASPIARVVKSQEFSAREDIAESGFEWCGCGTANEEARGIAISRQDTGVYTVDGSLGLATEGWRMMPPRDPDGSGDLGIVEAEEDENHVITIRLYRKKYMLTDDGEMVLTKGNLIDVPANSWIDIRLDMTPIDNEQP
ncbi:phage tail protein [Winslowiella sp. 2C04]|uniref:phage tail fiber protein n=1 Tax=Winslowiella sp. 2C04 TaxID=3416179 RepID=UPI003CEF71DC